MRNGTYISDKVRKGLKADAVGYALRGLNFREVSKAIGVHYMTFMKWKKEDPLFDKAMKDAKARFAKGRIESLLWKAAEGGTEEELSETYRETREINGEEVQCLVTRKRKVKAPSEKAIVMLANKYTDGEYSGLVEKAVHDKITQENRALSLKERIKLLKAEGNEAIPTDFRHLTNLDDDEAAQ